MAPLNRPQTSATISEPVMAAHSGAPYAYSWPIVIEESATMAPTNRSMPPEAITIAMPMAIRPISASRRVTVKKFDAVRKLGDSSVKTATSASRSTTSPAPRIPPARSHPRSDHTAPPESESQTIAGHRGQQAYPISAGDPDAGHAEDDDAVGDDTDQHRPDDRREVGPPPALDAGPADRAGGDDLELQAGPDGRLGAAEQA